MCFPVVKLNKKISRKYLKPLKHIFLRIAWKNNLVEGGGG